MRLPVCKTAVRLVRAIYSLAFRNIGKNKILAGPVRYRRSCQATLPTLAKRGAGASDTAALSSFGWAAEPPSGAQATPEIHKQCATDHKQRHEATSHRQRALPGRPLEDLRVHCTAAALTDEATSPANWQTCQFYRASQGTRGMVE